MAERVGDRIAQARRLLSVKLNRDIKQAEIAEMAGFSGAVWSRWETNRNRPGRDALARIERLFRKHGLLQVTAGWLDYGSGGKPAIAEESRAAPVRGQKRRPAPRSEDEERSG